MTAYVSILFALIGGVIWCLPINSKVCELGRLSFGAGILAFLLAIGHESVKLIS